MNTATPTPAANTGTNPNSTSPDPAAAAAGAAAPWYEGLQDEGLRASLSRYKTVDDMARGYSNMEKRAGAPAERQVLLPADPNDADGFRAIYARLGLPEKADGYNLSLGDNATDADKAMLSKFAERMHKVGALPGAVQEAVKFLQDEQGARLEAFTQARDAARTEATETLKREWGAAFDQNSKAVGQLLAKYGTPELARELEGSNIGNHPDLVRALHKIAEATMEPGALQGANQDAAAPNRPMSPAQAKAALAALNADPIKGVALMERSHPQHEAVVQERSRLLKLERGIAA